MTTYEDNELLNFGKLCEHMYKRQNHSSTVIHSFKLKERSCSVISNRSVIMMYLQVCKTYIKHNRSIH